MKKILITGAKGFLGSNVAKHFKALGYKTFGIGHGVLSVDELKEIKLDYWVEDDVSIKAILELKQTFDVIVHCGGSGSVGFSIEHPYDDFKKTVVSTIEVLEYMRVHNPHAHLVFPSSPSVQGEHPEIPIKEEYIGKPVSPYGYHKRIAEDLCLSYSEKYNLKIGIIRFFSIYGKGLKKQILWDACNKIKNSEKEVTFWGTGKETRDFIHVDDVVLLFEKALKANNSFMIINGGTGVGHSTKEIVYSIKRIIGKNVDIRFNNIEDVGNPKYYCADLTAVNKLNWEPKVSLAEGLKRYVGWYEEKTKND